jgi:hypothetical protein
MSERKSEALGRIEAPHFVAGIVFRDRIAVDAAPIVKYMHGWSVERVRDYCQRKEWEFYRVS